MGNREERLLGIGKEEEGKKDMSHSLTGVGGYVGLIQ